MEEVKENHNVKKLRLLKSEEKNLNCTEGRLVGIMLAIIAMTWQVSDPVSRDLLVRILTRMLVRWLLIQGSDHALIPRYHAGGRCVGGGTAVACSYCTAVRHHPDDGTRSCYLDELRI
jgi:hypothetical protein